MMDEHKEVEGMPTGRMSVPAGIVRAAAMYAAPKDRRAYLRMAGFEVGAEASAVWSTSGIAALLAVRGRKEGDREGAWAMDISMAAQAARALRAQEVECGVKGGAESVSGQSWEHDEDLSAAFLARVHWRAMWPSYTSGEAATVNPKLEALRLSACKAMRCNAVVNASYSGSYAPTVHTHHAGEWTVYTLSMPVRLQESGLPGRHVGLAALGCKGGAGREARINDLNRRIAGLQQALAYIRSEK